MKDQIDLLHSVVEAAKAPTSQNDLAEERHREDQWGQVTMNKDQVWLENNSHLPKKTKFESWMVKNADWQFTPNNRDYYYDTLTHLSGGSREKIMESVFEDTIASLDSFDTASDKESYFRDNAHTLPAEVLSRLQPYFEALRGHGDRKNIDRGRLGQIRTVQAVMDGWVQDHAIPVLNEAVALPVHIRDFLRLWDLGHTDITTDPSGRVAASIGNQLVPSYTIPDPEMSLEAEFISLNDLTPIVQKAFGPVLEQSRESSRESDKLASLSLLNDVESGNIPDEFVPNVIIDGVMELETTDKVSAVRGYITSMISKRIGEGSYESFGEVARSFFEMQDNITNTLNRRINHGEV